MAQRYPSCCSETCILLVTRLGVVLPSFFDVGQFMNLLLTDISLKLTDMHRGFELLVILIDQNTNLTRKIITETTLVT